MLGYCRLDPKKQTSVKLSSKYKTFRLRKCIWKYRLWNGDHFFFRERWVNAWHALYVCTKMVCVSYKPQTNSSSFRSTFISLTLEKSPLFFKRHFEINFFFLISFVHVLCEELTDCSPLFQKTAGWVLNTRTGDKKLTPIGGQFCLFTS